MVELDRARRKEKVEVSFQIMLIVSLARALSNALGSPHYEAQLG